ncbi:MAG TPA: hypothetical protein VGM51_12675 [Armatimonadota bacterium]
MLLELCGRLEQNMNRLQALRQDRRLIEQMQTRRGQVDDAVAGLRSAANSLHVLQSNDVPVQVPDDWARRILARTREIRAAVHEDTLAYGDLSGNRDFFRELGEFTAKLTENLSDAWRSYNGLHNVSMDPLVLDTLERFPRFQSDIANIRRLQRDVGQAGVRYPRRQDEFTRFRNAVDQLAIEWDRLSGDSLPDDVLKFLRAAASGGAALNILTDKVQEWLKAHSLSNTFHVTIRRTT